MLSCAVDAQAQHIINQPIAALRKSSHSPSASSHGTAMSRKRTLRQPPWLRAQMHILLGYKARRDRLRFTRRDLDGHVVLSGLLVKALGTRAWPAGWCFFPTQQSVYSCLHTPGVPQSKQDAGKCEKIREVQCAHVAVSIYLQDSVERTRAQFNSSPFLVTSPVLRGSIPYA